MVLSDRSSVFSISIGGFRGIFVEKLRNSVKNQYFWKKVLLNDLAVAKILCFKLEHYLLLCKISASTPQRLRVYKGQKDGTKKLLRIIYNI